MRSFNRVPTAAAVLALAFSVSVRADEPAGEAPAVPAVSAADRAKWGDHMGDLPFVVGSEAGAKAAAAAGKTPLYFFTATW